jgi:hypothetical protein
MKENSLSCLSTNSAIFVDADPWFRLLLLLVRTLTSVVASLVTCKASHLAHVLLIALYHKSNILVIFVHLTKNLFCLLQANTTTNHLLSQVSKCYPLNFKAQALIPCRFLMTKINKLKFCQTLSNIEITVFINFINAKTHIQKFPQAEIHIAKQNMQQKNTMDNNPITLINLGKCEGKPQCGETQRERERSYYYASGKYKTVANLHFQPRKIPHSTKSVPHKSASFFVPKPYRCPASSASFSVPTVNCTDCSVQPKNNEHKT